MLSYFSFSNTTFLQKTDYMYKTDRKKEKKTLTKAQLGAPWLFDKLLHMQFGSKLIIHLGNSVPN